MCRLPLVCVFVLEQCSLSLTETLEKRGVLVETDHTHLFDNDIVTPVGSLTAPQLPEGAVVSGSIIFYLCFCLIPPPPPSPSL